MVIAIIALLISILAPALGRAREISKRTLCASNLRQIGQILLHYSEDYEGWFPAKSKFGSPNAGVAALAAVQQDGTRNPMGPDGWGMQFAGTIRDIIERDYTRGAAGSPKYLADPKILICPSDTTGNVYAPSGTPARQLPVGPATDLIDIDATTTATVKNYSYMYIAMWRNDDRGDFFLMADESNESDLATNSLTGLTDEDNHGRRGINALFCDTHVEWQGARGGDRQSLQELAWRLWGPIVSARSRYPNDPGNPCANRSCEVRTTD